MDVEPDPEDVLDRQKCLDALAAVRHAKWFHVSSINQSPAAADDDDDVLVFSSIASVLTSLLITVHLRLCTMSVHSCAHVLRKR